MPAKAAKRAESATADPSAAPARPPKQGDHVFLVDGSSYIFRAYHALPPLTRKSDGLQVNAVLGFCNMLWKLMRDMKPEERPTHLAVVFDKSERTFRNEMYADYKANRTEPPDDLRPQFAFIREAVRAFDLPCLEQIGFEADDLIATYVRQACEAGATATIVASDKDLMQLINDCVVMYDTMKDRKIGIPEVIEKFGVPPEKVIEVQALIGDSTDNVPGVPGIGVKTAAQLIAEYGDLETLLSRAAEIKQEKRRQSLIENAEKARLSKRLVTLDAHVALDVPLAALAVHEPDYKRLISFLKAMEFTTLTRRVAEFSGLDPAQIEADGKLKAGTGAASPPDRGEPQAAKPAQARQALLPLPPSPASRAAAPSTQGEFTPQALAAARVEAAHNAKVDRSRYEVVRSLDRLAAWIERARDLGVVALDIRTTRLDPMQATLCGFALALAPNEACYVPLAHRKGGDGGDGGLFAGPIAPDQIEERAALAAMKPLLEDPGVLKLGNDLKYALQIFALRDIELTSYDDTMLMSYVLDAGRADHGIDALSKRYFDHATIDFDEIAGSGKSRVTFDCVQIDKAVEYAAEQADMALRLWHVLKPRMAAEHTATVYETLERPLVPVLARMERRGISIDRQVLSRLSGEFAQRAGALEAEIQALAGEPLNPGSPKQLGDILFGKLKLEGGVKTRTGQWSTGARVLDDLAEQGHPLPRKNSRLATGLQAQIDLYRCAARLRRSPHPPRPHQLRAGGDADRPAVLLRTEPAEHSDPHRGRPQDQARLHRERRPQARLRRLLADRAAAVGRNRRHRAAQESLSRRPRHPCPDRIRNVRRAGEGHAGGNPPPRQGDQLRHHLRHLGLRACQSARHRARGGRRLHQEIFRALPRHPRLHGRDQGVRQEERLRAHLVRP